jgi:hypothetical protein
MDAYNLAFSVRLLRKNPEKGWRGRSLLPQFWVCSEKIMKYQSGIGKNLVAGLDLLYA